MLLHFVPSFYHAKHQYSRRQYPSLPLSLSLAASESRVQQGAPSPPYFEPLSFWADFEKLRRLVENLFWRKIEKFFVYKGEGIKRKLILSYYVVSSPQSPFLPLTLFLARSSVLFTFFYYARNKSFICLQRFCVSEQPSIIRRGVRRLAGRRTGHKAGTE